MDEDDEEPPSKHMKKVSSIEEDLVEGGMRENGSHSHRAVEDENNEDVPGPREVTASQVEDYLEEAECPWRKAQRAWITFCMETDITEKAKKCITAEGFEDLSVWGLQ